MTFFPFSSPEPLLSSKGTQQPPGPQVTLEKNQLTIQSFVKGEVSSQSCISVQQFFFSPGDMYSKIFFFPQVLDYCIPHWSLNSVKSRKRVAKKNIKILYKKFSRSKWLLGTCHDSASLPKYFCAMWPSLSGFWF